MIIFYSPRMVETTKIRTIQLQEDLAVASIAQDDPSPLRGMHRDHNALPLQTDGQTDTDIAA